jgi:hypothetical protein
MQVQGPSGNVLRESNLPRRRIGWFRRLMADVFFVAKRDRTWWILPLVLLLFLIGGLLAFVTLAGPLAPFIYPLL